MGHWVEVLVCTTVPRTLPTQSKAGIRLLGASCQVWVGSESTKAFSCGLCSLGELCVFPQANNPAVSTRHVTLQTSSLPTTEELPPTQRTRFFQNWCVFPQHLPTNKFNESRVNLKKTLDAVLVTRLGSAAAKSQIVSRKPASIHKLLLSQAPVVAPLPHSHQDSQK